MSGLWPPAGAADAADATARARGVRAGGARVRAVPPSTAPDLAVAALQAAVAAEHAAMYGYGVAGARLGGRRQDAALRAWNAHRARRDQLIAMLAAQGAVPVAAAGAYRLPFSVTTVRSAVMLAAAIEDGVTRAYLGLVAVADPDLRDYGALAMQDAAVRAATWRGATVEFPGLPPSALSRQPTRAPGRGSPH